MELEKVSVEATKLIKYLGTTDLKIDEKIVVCRSVGDMLQQVMTMEVETVNMRNIRETFLDTGKQ